MFQRLDIFIADNFFNFTRSKASECIKLGFVRVDNKIISKPSSLINYKSDVKISENAFFNSVPFVSRSALKLRYFIKSNPSCKLCIKDSKIIDVGASAGGFSQTLLYFNAKNITTIDVGTNQIDKILKNDPRIFIIENMDIRNFSIHSLVSFDFLVCDVSFISLRLIFPYLKNLSNEMILLFKPQFEMNKKFNKKNITKALDDFLNFLSPCKIIKIDESKIRGKEGNEEYFIWLKT